LVSLHLKRAGGPKDAIFAERFSVALSIRTVLAKAAFARTGGFESRCLHQKSLVITAFLGGRQA